MSNTEIVIVLLGIFVIILLIMFTLAYIVIRFASIKYPEIKDTAYFDKQDDVDTGVLIAGDEGQ